MRSFGYNYQLRKAAKFFLYAWVCGAEIDAGKRDNEFYVFF